MPPAPARPAISPTHLAGALRLAVARLARRVRQEGTSAGDDLTASRLAALTTIEALGSVTLGELAAIEQVQPPSMTRIVARLEEGGLVERQVDGNDRRIVRVRVTPVGKRLLVQTRTKRDEFLARRVARLTEDERELLERAIPLLEKLQDDDS
jgi:DNA-binding MarR family transcriptional regulator